MIKLAPHKDCVYIVKGQQLYKIGVSYNPVKRIHDMNTGSEYELTLIYSVQVSKPYAVERYLHRLYAHKHCRLEWYALDDNDVLNIIDYLIHEA